MIRFKTPKLEQADGLKQIVLTEALSVDNSDEVVNGLIQQLNAHVVSERVDIDTGQQIWALHYGGASVDLIYISGAHRLIIRPLSTHSSCTLLDLYELFAVQSSQQGW